MGAKGGFIKLFFGCSRNLRGWGSGIMKLGSEGVYLHEKCGTNPSRHLPGSKNPHKKNTDLGVSGVSGEYFIYNKLAINRLKRPVC